MTIGNPVLLVNQNPFETSCNRFSAIYIWEYNIYSPGHWVVYLVQPGTFCRDSMEKRAADLDATPRRQLGQSFEAAAAKPIETEVEPLTDGLAPELAKAPFNMIPLVERLDRNTEGSSPENWLFVLDFERNTYGAEPFCVVCLGNAF